MFRPGSLLLRAFGNPWGMVDTAPYNSSSLGFADPDTGIGDCYAPNRIGAGLTDQREVAIQDALDREVLGDRPQMTPTPARVARPRGSTRRGGSAWNG